MPDETIVAVDAPHFNAALIMVGDRCTEAAPILRWAVGKDRAELSAYFKRKGWKALIVKPRRPRPICERCGEPIGPKSHTECLRAWNGNWYAFFWRTYMRHVQT